jgi:hypothetical protein
MTGKQRDELRQLQDEFLALWPVREFVRVHGAGAPLWVGGPSYLEVKLRLYPQWRGEFQWHVRQESNA